MEARFDSGGEQPPQPPINPDFDAAAAAGELSVSGAQNPEGGQLYLEEVVLDLIGLSERGKTYIGDIVYALTLQKKGLPKDVFRGIKHELRTIEDNGGIIYDGSGGYHLSDSSAEKYQSSSTSLSSAEGTKPRKKPTNKQRANALDSMMHQALGTPVVPKMGPKRRADGLRRRHSARSRRS